MKSAADTHSIKTPRVYARHVFVCTNQKPPGKTCCANTGGLEYANYLKEKLTELNLHGAGKIRVSTSGCLGRCSLGPCIVVYPEGLWFTYRDRNDLDAIIEQCLSGQNEQVYSNGRLLNL